jgi:hypothetical protein
MKSCDFWDIISCKPLSFPTCHRATLPSSGVCLPHTSTVASFSANALTLTMEAICSYETFLDYQQPMRRDAPKNGVLPGICQLYDIWSLGDFNRSVCSVLLLLKMNNFQSNYEVQVSSPNYEQFSWIELQEAIYRLNLVYWEHRQSNRGTLN